MRLRVLVALLALCARATFAQDPSRGGWVVLPVDDYRQLRAHAYPERPPEPPPVEATLTRIDYDLRANGEAATGEARLVIDVLKDGWVKVPIPSGLKVRESRLDGRPVSLADGGVLLSRPGRSVLVLDVAVMVASAAGNESLTLPPATAAVSRIALTLPRAGVDVVVHEGQLVEKSEAARETKVVATVAPGAAARLSWRRKAGERRTGLPVRLRGSVTSFVGLGEDGAQTNAHVRVEVTQGEAISLTLGVPDGLVINQVGGPLVSDWEQRSGSLVVSFLEPVERQTAFVVTGEARLAREGTIAIPLLRMPAAERETGGVAVEVLGAGEPKDRDARGLDPSDPQELGEPVAGRDSPSLVAYRYRPQPGASVRSLSVSVTRYTPQAVLVANVEEARYQALATEDGKTLVRARWAVRNNQRSFLAVTLPKSATLWSASVAGRPVKPGHSAEGALLLPLEKARSGGDAPAFAVELVYVELGSPWTDKGSTTLSLPALDLPVSRTGLELRHPPRFKVVADPGAFRTQAFEAPISAALTGGVEMDDFAKEKAEVKVAAPIQGLIDKLRTVSSGRSATGVLPLSIPFPAVGPLVYMASQLTAEAKAPAVTVAYRRGGAR